MNLYTLQNTAPWEWPENADEILLGILLDDRAEPSDRLLAVELAGEYVVMNDELADALLSYVRSSQHTDALRAKAAISLGPALEHADIEEFEDPEDELITEDMFHRIEESFHAVYMDAGVPKEVRRRVLEASVRAPQDWHHDAVGTAYASDDEEWKLTAVFCMRYIRGFESQILEALNSESPEMEYEAVCAAGNGEVEAAWPHIADLITSDETDKPLLFAAIEASVGVNPHEAQGLLAELMESEDEDVAEAAHEAFAMAEVLSRDLDEDDEDEFPF
jgi:hypothetical protein